jgi:hypothetical protein
MKSKQADNFPKPKFVVKAFSTIFCSFHLLVEMKESKILLQSDLLSKRLTSQKIIRKKIDFFSSSFTKDE